VEGIVDTARGYLEAALTKDTPEKASKLVRSAEILGEQAYDMLRELEGSDASSIPHQIVGPFVRWVDGLGIENTIFFRTDHHANYELVTSDVDELLSSLENPSPELTQAVADVNWPFLRLTVPSRALGMLPHFAIIGHELGHAIHAQIDVDEANFADLDRKSIEATERRFASFDGKWALPSITKRRLILEAWITEVKADAIGYLLAGPAFYFALGAFFELIGRRMGITENHPPSALRRRFVLERMGEGAPSFTEVFKASTGLAIGEETTSPHLPRVSSLDDLFQDLQQTVPDVGRAAILVELVPVIEAMAPAIFSAANKLMAEKAPHMIYTPAQLEIDLARHLEPLCNLIPPIEYRDGDEVKASCLASILNVGAAALLTRLDRMPAPAGMADADPVAHKIERLHELLLKAVELSEARLLWEAH
jgi:hypothetical protein